jgi:MerR family transcriptional regulator/heat shock protein HspR
MPLPGRPENSSLAEHSSSTESRTESSKTSGRTLGTDEEMARTQEPAQDPTQGIEGLYIISVAARILEMHPQTLRKYERLGLINPGRTIGMLRLYSIEDIRKVRLIRRLSDIGLNLAGIEFALGTAENLQLLNRRLQSLASDDASKVAIASEINALLNSLGLSVDD